MQLLLGLEGQGLYKVHSILMFATSALQLEATSHIHTLSQPLPRLLIYSCCALTSSLVLV